MYQSQDTKCQGVKKSRSHWGGGSRSQGVNGDQIISLWLLLLLHESEREWADAGWTACGGVLRAAAQLRNAGLRVVIEFVDEDDAVLIYVAVSGQSFHESQRKIPGFGGAALRGIFSTE